MIRQFFLPVQRTVGNGKIGLKFSLKYDCKSCRISANKLKTRIVCPDMKKNCLGFILQKKKNTSVAYSHK